MRMLVVLSMVISTSALAMHSSRTKPAPHKEQVYVFKGASSVPKMRPGTLLSNDPKSFELNTKSTNMLIQAETDQCRLALLFIIGMCILIASIVIVAICLFGVGSQQYGKGLRKLENGKEKGDKRVSGSSQTPSSPAPVGSFPMPDIEDSMGSSCLYAPAPAKPAYVPSYSVKSPPLALSFVFNDPLALSLASLTATPAALPTAGFTIASAPVST